MSECKRLFHETLLHLVMRDSFFFLEDCWFIAATACLACSHPQLLERCVPPDQEFDKDYAGLYPQNSLRFNSDILFLLA